MMTHSRFKLIKATERGFTLVEVLIALFIFSLISVGATSALTSSLRGQTQMNERLDGISEIETMRALITADMANMTLHQRRDAYGGLEPYVLRADREAVLEFTRTGRSNPLGEPRGDLQTVDYRFTNNKFIRRSYAQINPAPQSVYTDRVLLTGVTQLDIGFESYARNLGLTLLLKDIRIEPEGSTETLGAMKLTLDLDTGDTLTQYFELGL